MKTYKTLTIIAIAILTVSCGKNAKQNNDTKPERVVETVNKETGIISLTDYSHEDTLSIRGTKYTYKFSFQAVDSLEHIKNTQGLEYLDNVVNLTILKGEEVVTKRTFYKSSFKSYVPSELWQNSGLVGFSFNFVRQERDAFYFIATIGDPDETADISYPLEIRITTDGGMTINKAQNLDTEPLRDGLNIDPSADDGV